MAAPMSRRTARRMISFCRPGIESGSPFNSQPCMLIMTAETARVFLTRDHSAVMRRPSQIATLFGAASRLIERWNVCRADPARLHSLPHISTSDCISCRLSLISRRLQSAQKRRRRAVNRRCLEAMVRGLLLFLFGVATRGGSPFFIAISTLSFTRKSCCPAALQALA